MDNPSLREKTGKIDRLTGKVDRLTILPEEILVNILSFMKTKEAVKTSVLAKNYRHLWACSRALDFDIDDFISLADTTYDMDEETLSPIEEKFEKTVDKALARRGKLDLDSFKVVWDQDRGNPTPALKWLNNVAALNPKFLSVHIYSDLHEIEAPNSLFTTESLQKLDLQVPINPKDVHLPSLKNLKISDMIFDKEILKMLLGGSPVLEEMTLTDSSYISNSDIASETLKRLVLDGLQKIDDPPEILLSVPSLEFLEVRSWASGKLKFKKVESLLGAQIHLEELSNVEPWFLTGLSNVIRLELVFTVSCLQGMLNALANGTIEFPSFKNLEILKLGKWSMSSNFDLVRHFLLNAPKLKKLTLFHFEPYSNSDVEISFVFGDRHNIKGTIHQGDESTKALVEFVRTRINNIWQGKVAGD